ncbi:PAS domain S-box protein [Methylomonas methanica]|uniref:Signal transduction histidine kinase n=1 Tax=Methylomonas methanica (strain DSM 25384 / MC09) TaxID=857087 RepID=G0A4N3_METMM|nr:PAS domain S-box protein [Methylomonas methanica]AEG02774.1 signal transduction histidine kinase [Methylomonas methanica MC09]
MLYQPESDEEMQRLQALHAYRILDTPPEQDFDDIVTLAAQTCAIPFVVFSLVDEDREWFKSKKGITLTEQCRTSGFAAHTLPYQDVFVITDVSEDARFSANPLVMGEPHIRFYAGMPVRSGTGEAVGALGVLDSQPRTLSPAQTQALRILARQIGVVLALRLKTLSETDTPEILPQPRSASKELQLQKSARFIRAVLAAFSKQFCVLDENATILEVNKPWLDFETHYGGGKPMLEIGQNYLELLDAGLANDRGGKAFADGIRSVLSGASKQFSLEYAFPTPSGQLWFSGKVLPCPDPELSCVFVIHENISEHKQLEDRFRQAVESAPNAIVMVNESGTILMVNAQTESSFGYSRKEMIGQAVEMLVPERFRSAHKGFRQAYLSNPESRPMGAGRDLYGQRKDGSEFPVEIGLGLIENHSETLVLSSIVDITERKRLEHRFRQAVESAPNAIVMVNESGRILMVNAQTELSFGYSRQELVGQAVEILVPERFRGAHVAFRQAYLAAPVSRPMGAGRELYGLRKDGSEFPVEIGLGLIDDENGTIVLSSIVDITERKHASDKLKQALNEKEVLLKEVYHRVKNNLQVVSSLINLQAGSVTDETTQNLLRQSADRIKAMAILHEKLYQSKDLARIDFNEYIRSLVNHLLYGYGTQTHKIEISMRVDDVFLDVDTAIPCGLIINELLSNALKYAFPEDRPGTIRITFTREQDDLVLSIGDDGIGLPSNLDFKQTTSLGLQLVDTLSHQLMGQMSLDRTNGSTFTLRFAETA